MSETKTWEYNGATFTNCLKCGKGIPTYWKEHKACGWKSELASDPLPQKDVREFKKAESYKSDGDERVNSMSLSYAKDLVVADKINLNQIKDFALAFKQFIKNGEMATPK